MICFAFAGVDESFCFALHSLGGVRTLVFCLIGFLIFFVFLYNDKMIGIKVYADKLADYVDWDVDYFEVYIRHIDHLGRPVTLKEQLEMLKPVQHKVFGIHGGILYQGCNFLDKDAYDDNKKALDVVFESLDFFSNCKYIVFHPGVFVNSLSCSFDELFTWIRPIQDKRFMLEIEPVFAYKERYVLPLYTPQDWLAVKNEIDKDIVVDTGHLLISARALKLDPITYISDMVNTLDPKVIHLANNDSRGDGFEDSHLSLAQGDLDISKIKHLLVNRLTTIEVGNLSFADLSLVKSLNLSGVVKI